nr:protein suppressor of k(+) transport growth defect 1 [Quercus suber]
MSFSYCLVDRDSDSASTRWIRSLRSFGSKNKQRSADDYQFHYPVPPESYRYSNYKFTLQEVCDGVKDVLILAATNTPFALDQAIRRRFDKRIYVHLPDKEARKHIFKVQIGKTLKTISEKEFDKLANNTEGFSSSDISYFVKDALYEVVRATLTNEFFKRSGEKLVPCKRNEKERVSLQEIDENGENSKIKVPPCTAAHFEKVRGNQKATVTKDDLKRFDEFTEKFGIYG